MFFGGRKDVEESVLTSPKDGTAAPKPSDVRNGDLVSLLLAATPPYLYNMPLVPQTFFFSEMLRSFVHAKTERQNAKAHHVSRRRKRSWREATPPKSGLEDKPLELTTTRSSEKDGAAPDAKRPTPSCDFTAEKLANSSVPPEGGADDGALPTPPLWYPNLYNHPQYPIDPLHFFIDLRVSAHIWDRKLSAGSNEQVPPTSPLNLASYRSESSNKVDLHKYRQNSAFSVPNQLECQENASYGRSNHSVHYLMNNLKDIYGKREKDDTSVKEGEDQRNDDEENKKKVHAVSGIDLVSEVKEESDASDGEVL